MYTRITEKNVVLHLYAGHEKNYVKIVYKIYVVVLMIRW
jgi:hypothetical protein